MPTKRSSAGRRASRRTGEAPRSAQDPGNDQPLSRDRIVAAAIELLDAQGVDGLTTRRLADRLGSGVMSLYWHVASKDDVFDLALDKVLEYRGAPQIVESQNWRADTVYMLEDWRATMLCHPWSALLLPRRPLGPNMLSRLELLGQTLSRAGVEDADLNAAIWSLWNYVMGATITRASFGLSDADMAAAQQRLSRLGELYPAIERSRLLLDDDWDGVFRRGLDFLLDGLAARR